MSKEPQYKIQIQNNQTRFKIQKRNVASLCSKILDELDHPACAVSVAFVGRRMMQMLNHQYRGKDGVTDVLSFSFRGETDDNLSLLGEIIICPDVAAKNASSWNRSAESEIRMLVTHGILHLIGYDHETDDGEMNRLQRRLLDRRSITGSPAMLR